MSGIIKKIGGLAKNRTTYKIGLLQAKAYRVLKARTGGVLMKYKISTVEWALLGLLYSNKEGMKSFELAEELGVEASFITALFSKLSRRELVHSVTDAKDSRVKIIRLRPEKRAFVRATEKEVRAHMKDLIKDIPLGDLLSYVSVLEQIINNSKKLK